MVPSGAGSEVNKVLDKCVSGSGKVQESRAGKGSLQCVCVSYTLVKKKKSEQRPHGYKCHTCQIYDH